ncbi:hypothetical protein I5U25_05715 [Stenotrophomonas maltophilia]|nr:hypothetical protein [Stenotrophomonas maltophilia]
MSNDNKTLADVQPGGRVRLGDAIPRPLEDLRDATRHVIDCADGGDDYSCGRPMIDALTTLGILEKTGRGLWSVNAQEAQAVFAALSAQPSPGGQGDALLDHARKLFDELGEIADDDKCVEILAGALAARQPVGEPPMQMRICELRHVSLKPNRPYVFTVDANCANCRADAAYAMGQTDTRPAQAVDLADFKTLYRAYVRLLESGRDRILDLGGTCDPVDVMEANDVDLQAARRVLDSQGVGNG